MERLVQTTQAKRVSMSVPVFLDTLATTVNTTLTNVPAIPVRMEQHVMTWSMDTTVPAFLASLVSFNMYFICNTLKVLCISQVVKQLKTELFLP